MKKDLPLISLAAAAVILAATYFAVSANSDPAVTGRLAKSGRGETLSSIEIKNSYGDFVFRQEDGEWLVSDGDNEYYTNDDKMLLLTDALLNFEVLRVLPEDQPVYALAQPRAAVSFTTSSGREELIVIGGSCPDVTESYARANGVDGVLIARAGSVAQLTGSIDAYRTNQVFIVDLTALRSVEYKKGGETQIAVKADDSGEWSMSYPVAAGARKLELDDFVASLRGWSIADYPESFKAAAPENEEYLTLTDAAGNSQSLRLGAEEGTLRYAQLGGKENTVALYAADVDLTPLDADALIYETPLYRSVNDVASIAMNIGGELFALEVDNTARTVKLNGEYVSYDDFTGFYYRYVLLLADGWDGEGQPGDAVASFETALTDGDKLTLLLYERDEETLFMSYGGGEGFYLELDRLELLLERLAALIN